MSHPTCGTCNQDYKPSPPPVNGPRYTEEDSKPLISEAATPGCVQRMCPLKEPCMLKQTSPITISSDIHSPDSPPRVTQTNIGKYLSSTQPDSANGNSQDPLEDRVLKQMVERERANWVDTPGKNAPLLFCVNNQFSTKQSFDPVGAHRSKYAIFPRSDQLELKSIVARERAGGEQATQEAPCDCLPSAHCCMSGPRKSLAKCQTPWWWHPVPCWWRGDASIWPVPIGDPDDYAIIPISDEELKGHEKQDLMKILLLNRRERYIPGQIYCDERRKIQGQGNWQYNRCHPAPPPLTAEQISTQAMSDERDTCYDRPWSKAAYGTVIGHGAAPDMSAIAAQKRGTAEHKPCAECLDQKRRHQVRSDDCARLRQQELFRVGQPFKSAACRFQHELYPPQRAKVIGRTPTREFPHTRLTNI